MIATVSKQGGRRYAQMRSGTSFTQGWVSGSVGAASAAVSAGLRRLLVGIGL